MSIKPISVKWVASDEGGRISFDYVDLGTSEKEWSKLDQTERIKLIQNALDEEPEQPYMIFDQYDES